MSNELDDEVLEELYAWLDEIPMTRPKKEIRRDFSDGVLTAEVVKHYIPHIVEIHNYQNVTGVQNKITNWKLLNRKVFRKLGFELGDDVIKNVVNCRPFAVEQMLILLRRKIDRFLYEKKRSKMGGRVPPPPEPVTAVSDRPEADQQHQHISRQPEPQPGSSTVNPRAPQEYRDKPSGSQPPSGSIVLHPLTMPVPKNYKGEVVPKILVEEKEQELLTKDETIQILQAKIRRLEHLLHLKDIRVDDLTTQLNTLEHQMRPTMQIKPAQGKLASRKH